MTLFQVRNRRTKMVLGEVEVDDPETVLDELAASTGTTIEEIAHSLGATADEARAALDIAVVRTVSSPKVMTGVKSQPPRRLLYTGK